MMKEFVLATFNRFEAMAEVEELKKLGIKASIENGPVYMDKEGFLETKLYVYKYVAI